MENLELYNKVRSVPQSATKQFNNGKFSGTDINPMWRIKTLTEQFGVCGFGWYYEIIDKQLKEGALGEICCFVDINLYVKIDGEWSKAIQGTGGNMFVSSTKNGLKNSDECFKMALTDAISVAAKSLGIGADIYFEKDETKYTKYSSESQQKPKEIERDAERDGKILSLIEGHPELSLKMADVWINRKFQTTIKDANREQFNQLVTALMESIANGK